jgi:hypothetical protein
VTVKTPSIYGFVREAFIEMLDFYATWRNSLRSEHHGFSFVPGPPGITFAHRENGKIATYNQDHCVIIIADIVGDGFCLLHSSSGQIGSEITKLNRLINGRDANIYIIANEPESFVDLFPCGAVKIFKKNKRCVASLIAEKSDSTITIKLGQQYKLIERNNWLKYLGRIPRCRMRKIKFLEITE